MEPDREVLLQLHRKMLLVRALEKRVERLVTEARIPCSGHFGLGQEAVGVGATGPLLASDFLFGTHRGFAEYIGKGLTPREILAEYYGKATSPSAGRLGQHLLKVEIGIMPLPSSLGSEFGMSVGCALSSHRRGTNAVTLNLTSWPGVRMEVGSTKVLNPASFSLVKRTSSEGSVFNGKRHAWQTPRGCL